MRSSLLLKNVCGAINISRGKWDTPQNLRIYAQASYLNGHLILFFNNKFFELDRQLNGHAALHL